MNEQPMIKSASEINLAIKMANIIEDAVKTKIGRSASGLILDEAMYGRVKKIVTAAQLTIPPHMQRTVNFLRNKGVTGLELAAILTAIYGLYAGGKRIGNKIKDMMGDDPNKKGNSADPYEYINDPYKNQGTNIPNRSREVYPGYYEPEAANQDWYQQSEREKLYGAGTKTGIPAQFGIEPGFSVGTRPTAQSEFSQTLDKLRQSNYPLQTMAQNRKKKVFAQAAGSFTSDSMDKIIGGEHLNPDVAGWIQPNSFEQFLSQGAGQYAASPTAESAFFDPTGRLGRDKPMEFKPPGAGQDFATIDPIAYKKGRFEAFNQAEPQRQAARSIYLMRLLDLKEKSGAIDPNQAAALRQEIAGVLQLNPKIQPEQFTKIEQMIGVGMEGGAMQLPGQQYTPETYQTNVDWEALGKDPLAKPIHQQLMNKALTAMDEYQESPLYQNTINRSPLLGNPSGAILNSNNTATL